ncbi:hypothetical protein SAMN04487848_1163 [Microbacterium sp. ru370.1]|uniref:hypothetical protein n=1 Tax=unclassified Microbacterium TaxID=2609290 RepID=UPI0008899F57|nr:MULTISPECIES: hypothetical protein [unclassified Microbacterium]SDO49499.1 hypothetical protein SAMN04487848_1163 [Microbacterium sp. ru370.1]SIT82753.1 hypothetical protein SAMN05880579_1159 [Microbacterium sp. RU1D]
MFSLTNAHLRPTWKRVEDDFVMGACAHRLFGYVSQDPDGVWSAFDEDARVVAVGADLRAVSEALWDGHIAAHDDHCAPAGEEPWWRRSIRVARERHLA